MIGSVAASRDDRHIRIDVLSHLLPEGFIKAPRVLVDTFAAGVCAVIAWQAINPPAGQQSTAEPVEFVPNRVAVPPFEVVDEEPGLSGVALLTMMAMHRQDPRSWDAVGPASGATKRRGRPSLAPP